MSNESILSKRGKDTFDALTKNMTKTEKQLFFLQNIQQQGLEELADAAKVAFTKEAVSCAITILCVDGIPLIAVGQAANNPTTIEDFLEQVLDIVKNKKLLHEMPTASDAKH
jgi:hypothetical protein